MSATAGSDFDITALYDALDRERRARGLTWSATAEAVSALFRDTPARPISASTLAGMRDRSSIEGDGVLQILRWLDRAPESFVPGYSQATRLPEVPSNRILRFDTTRIHAALDARRVERGMTWTEVAAEIPGCSAASLTHLSKGGRTMFPQVVRIATWAGVSVASFTRASNR